jgi:hypothetical protein
MLTKTTKRDYLLTITIGLVGTVLPVILPLLFHDVILENIQQTMSNVSSIIIMIIGAYSAIIFADILSDVLQLDVEQKKFKPTPKNLKVYGLRSMTIFSMVFAELALLWAEIPNFFAHISDSGQGLSLEQAIVLHIFVLCLGVFMTWNLQKQKIDFEIIQ